MHENQSYPPLLSEFGNLRLTKKSDLIECMSQGITQTPPESITRITTSVICANV